MIWGSAWDSAKVGYDIGYDHETAWGCRTDCAARGHDDHRDHHVHIDNHGRRDGVGLGVDFELGVEGVQQKLVGGEVGPCRGRWRALESLVRLSEPLPFVRENELERRTGWDFGRR